MLYKHYIECIQGKSINSGQLKVFYSSQIDPWHQTPRTTIREPEDLFFNLVHPSGSQLKTITYGGQQKAAVDSTLLPGVSIGRYDYPIEGYMHSGWEEGYYSGPDLVQVGFEVNYDNWSAILDIGPELCVYQAESNLSRVLFSTMDSHDTPSGFYIGINQANKLYIECKEANSSPSVTLNSEVGKNSVVNIQKNTNSVFVGLYNLDTQELDGVTLNYQNHPSSNRMYLGNFFNNTNTNYTGYQGYIKDFALFDSNLSSSETISSCQCMFSTGVKVESITSEIFLPNVTGFKEEIQYITGVTGYVEAVKEVTDHGSVPPTTMLVTYQSGVTGLVDNGTETVFLTGAPSVVSNTSSATGMLEDQDKLDFYNRYFLNFNNGLKSGENIEILSFSDPREDVQLNLNKDNQVKSSNIRLYNYGLYRQSVNDPSYMTQGLRGESGAYIATDEINHDYDYTVLEDKTLSGFLTYENSIVYDLIDTNAICIDYSGYWSHMSDANAAVLGLEPNRIYTGAGGYFPPVPQFFNETNSNSQASRDQGQVVITGISGQKIWENNHIYYNGQKLIENIDFFTGNIETGNDISIDALVITGGLPGVSVDTNLWSSSIPAESFYTPQMCFVPKVSGEQPSITLKSIEGCSNPPYCSDSQYTNQGDCEAIGTCSNSNYNNDKATCLANGLTWTQTNTWYNTHGSKTLCESKGGTWEGDGIDGIPDPLSGFSEMVWLNGVRLTKDLDYKKGKECSLTKSFTFFGENPFIFYNNNEEYLNYS